MLLPKLGISLIVTLLVFVSVALADERKASLNDSSRSKAQRPESDDSNVRNLLALLSRSPGKVSLDRIADLLSGSGRASTNLHVDVRSGGSNSITVGPGAEVTYEVVGVLSDDSNEGLALFGLNLLFDGGDLAQADTPTGVPTSGCDNPMINFTIPWGITNPDGFGGTVINGDLIQVGGGQNTINNTPDNAPYPIGPVLTGVAQPAGCGPAVLVTGTLTAPDAEGTYVLSVEELFANVILEGETGDPFWATSAAGVGMITNLSISVSESRDIPTVSEWGLLVLGLLLLAGGKIYFHESRRVRA
ncbi:MAG: hypothetical protein WBE26_12045 [Phycisphaerae bacterium]